MHNEKLNISIVTVCYNSAEFIERCIKSVQSQTYENIEHIIVDGGSNDDTVKIIKACSDCNTTLVSEPDDGIYDAMNKSLNFVTGDVIFFLNSDDFFADDMVVENVMCKFNLDRSLEVVVAGIAYFSDNNIIKMNREWRVTPNDRIDFKCGWHPPHPGFFAKWDCYQNAGNFDLALKVSADFDLMLRFIVVHKFKLTILDIIATMMYEGGFSSSWKNRIIGNLNIILSFRKYGIYINPIVYLYRRISPKLISRFRRVK